MASPSKTRRRAPAAAAPARGDEAAAAHLVDAKTAAALLGVKSQTLYAYVSRGLIRTAQERDGKLRFYYREDVERVRVRGRQGTGVAIVPAERLLRAGGSGVPYTSITSIGPDGPSYRGRPAVDLVRQHRRFEDCVELLWGGVLPTQAPVWRTSPAPASFAPFAEAIARVAPHNSTRRLMALSTEAYSACTGRNAELALGAPVLAARQILQTMAPVFGLLRERPRYAPLRDEQPLAAGVARACGLDTAAELLHAIDACLVICADHELAPSTFAARIAASAGADLFSCVNSALGAFEGVLTGMGCDASEAALRDAASPRAYVEQLDRRRQRKEPVSGYGHPLYPGGDPRAVVLLALARALGGRDAATKLALQCIDAAAAQTGLAPNIAIGLAAVATALHLPRQAPGALMALGRTAGWVAHAFEQRLAGFLVRPRARYIGPQRVEA